MKKLLILLLLLLMISGCSNNSNNTTETDGNVDKAETQQSQDDASADTVSQESKQESENDSSDEEEPISEEDQKELITDVCNEFYKAVEFKNYEKAYDLYSKDTQLNVPYESFVHAYELMATYETTTYEIGDIKLHDSTSATVTFYYTDKCNLAEHTDKGSFEVNTILENNIWKLDRRDLDIKDLIYNYSFLIGATWYTQTIDDKPIDITKEEAIECLLESGTSINYYQSNIFLGWIYDLDKSSENAIHVYNTAVNSIINNSIDDETSILYAYQGLSRNYYNLNDLKNAILYAKKSLEIDPNSEEMKDILYHAEYILNNIK